MKKKIILILLCASSIIYAQEARREILVKKNYINIPVQTTGERKVMTFSSGGEPFRSFNIRLGNGQPDYWVFADVSGLKGEHLTITYPENVRGFRDIYQADEIAGSDSMYNETHRPQFHFTSRRGWNNDPNGLVYYAGEYHLFYQHNPFEVNWENMHWGHAVSTDLVHWQELPDALYPDELGTMFSGSAVIDMDNTAGFQSGTEKPIIAAYTANGPDKQLQCIAYSNDRGRTFIKYEGNPVIDSKETWNHVHTRDPKIFWHEGSGKWVMVLYEKDGHSIYNSDDLKEWTYQSHLGGFYECPELFLLPVDGNPDNVKWVMYGASGTYMIGRFDGRVFSPETEKLNYYSGKMYAAQTFNNIPDYDGRRIQIGWGSIQQKGMPFNQMMTFPTELSLRSTRDGIRLFSEPVKEISNLYNKSHYWRDLTTDEANEKLKLVKGDMFHIKITFQVDFPGAVFNLTLDGQSVARYDFNHNLLNDRYYGGDRMENLTLSLELLIDRTSVEVYADHGRFTIISELPGPNNGEGLRLDAWKFPLMIHRLVVHELNSAW